MMLGSIGRKAEHGAEVRHVLGIDIGFAHHGDGLAGAVGARSPERRDIVNRGEIRRDRRQDRSNHSHHQNK